MTPEELRDKLNALVDLGANIEFGNISSREGHAMQVQAINEIVDAFKQAAKAD